MRRNSLIYHICQRLLTNPACLLFQDNHKLYLQLIDVEYGKSKVSEAVMAELFDRCIRSELELEHRVAFSQRKLEFLEDFGSSADR